MSAILTLHSVASPFLALTLHQCFSSFGKVTWQGYLQHRGKREEAFVVAKF